MSPPRRRVEADELVVFACDASGRRVRDLRTALSELLAAARLDADAGGEGLAQLHRRIEVSS